MTPARQNDLSVSFCQTTHKGMGFAIGLCMAIAGLLFFCVGIALVTQRTWSGLILSGFSVLFLLFGGSLLLPHFRKVEFVNDEIQLKLGKAVCARYPIAEIRCLASGTVQTNPRPERTWKPKVILLSTRSGEQILQIGKIAIENAREHPATPPFVGVDSGNPAVVVDAFVKMKFEGIHLERGEGLWLEYTPERAERLRILLPLAEDLLIT